MIGVGVTAAAILWLFTAMHIDRVNQSYIDRGEVVPVNMSGVKVKMTADDKYLSPIHSIAPIWPEYSCKKFFVSDMNGSGDNPDSYTLKTKFETRVRIKRNGIYRLVLCKDSFENATKSAFQSPEDPMEAMEILESNTKRFMQYVNRMIVMYKDPYEHPDVARQLLTTFDQTPEDQRLKRDYHIK